MKMRKICTMSLLALATTFTACKKDKENENKMQAYQLNSTASTATWKGYLRNGYFNTGTIRVESRSFNVKDGQVQDGYFEMPLSGLQNTNLPNDTLKQMLIHHLQSADFFNMALHPNLSFTISRVQAYTGTDTAAVAGANKLVEGSLTMLGKPIAVSFPARITFSGNDFSLEGKVKIDRTKWGMNYATADTLKDDQYIMPVVDIELKLKGNKK